MLKKIKASEVQVGDLIKVDNTTYKIIKTDKGYNAVNIDCDNDYADSEDKPSLEQYIKGWLYTWNGQVEFCREVKEAYTFTEILKLAETKEFKAIAKGNKYDFELSFKDGVMLFKASFDNYWKNAVVSIWWNNLTYIVDEDSIIDLGRNLLND